MNLKTGNGRVIAQGPGTPSLGMKVDGRGRLFVAGGDGGDARVINLRTVGYPQLPAHQSATAFVNDVILTRGAAWFTDSQQQQLYRVAISATAGSGPPAPCP